METTIVYWAYIGCRISGFIWGSGFWGLGFRSLGFEVQVLDSGSGVRACTVTPKP